jgi:hypothetical protein
VYCHRILLLFHPPEGGLVVGWRIVAVFLLLFHPPMAGFLIGYVDGC